MKKSHAGMRALVSTIGMLVLLLAGAPARAEAPFTISMVSTKGAFSPGEFIPVQIKVRNTSGEDVIIRAKSFDEMHKKLTVIGPDGLPSRRLFAGGGVEPGPPPARIPVEILADGEERLAVVQDLRFHYDLSQPRRYTAQVVMSVETWSTSSEDPDTGARFASFADRDQHFDLVSNTIAFEITSPLPSNRVEVQVNLLKVGPGATPPVTATPVEDIQVRLIRLADVPADLQPVGFRSCELVHDTVDPLEGRHTDASGTAAFDDVRQDDYVFSIFFPQALRFRNVCAQLRANNPAWGGVDPIEVPIRILQLANDRVLPAQATTRRSGSELLIIEPQYVLWDGDQETYPFVFESIGDWDVTTSVSPPEGFVADHDSLSTVVVNEMGALQFTITDAGSRWEETAVTYRIKHKGKSEVIRNKIGVKLSTELAKGKGLGIYGHTEHPGLSKRKKVQLPK